MLPVPRIAAGALERRARVAIAAAAGEFDHRELRGEDRAAPFQFRDDGCVLSDDLVAIRWGAPRGRRATRREQVLRAVRDPSQWAALLFRERDIGALRLVERALGRQRGDRVVSRSKLSEEIEGCASEFDRGDAPLTESRGELGRGAEPNFGEAQSGLKIVGGSVSIGMRCARNSVAAFCTISRASSASRAGSSMFRSSRGTVSAQDSVLGSAKESKAVQYRRQSLVERPLSPRDYDMPVGWWGWNWEPPIPMSVTELLEARNMDARTAALCGMVLEAHGSILIAAEQPHSGKTTTLTAFLDFLPIGTRRIFLRGWVETFDYLKHTAPERTILLGNELSSHLPVYLWGPKAVQVFETLRKGYAIGSTLHADSADEAIAQLTGELGVAPHDLARVDLLMVMRVYATIRGQYARRVVSLHRLTPRQGTGLRLLPLVEHRENTDDHEHDENAELELVAQRRRQDVDTVAAELERRTKYLCDLLQRRRREIPDGRAALAE